MTLLQRAQSRHALLEERRVFLLSEQSGLWEKVKWSAIDAALQLPNACKAVCVNLIKCLFRVAARIACLFCRLLGLDARPDGKSWFSRQARICNAIGDFLGIILGFLFWWILCRLFSYALFLLPITFSVYLFFNRFMIAFCVLSYIVIPLIIPWFSVYPFKGSSRLLLVHWDPSDWRSFYMLQLLDGTDSITVDQMEGAMIGTGCNSSHALGILDEVTRSPDENATLRLKYHVSMIAGGHLKDRQYMRQLDRQFNKDGRPLITQNIERDEKGRIVSMGEHTGRPKMERIIPILGHSI